MDLHNQDAGLAQVRGCSSHMGPHPAWGASGWCPARRTRTWGGSLPVLGVAAAENLKQKETITDLPFSSDQTKQQFRHSFSGANSEDGQKNYLATIISG